jgi:23S rRNA pseudouridine2605 synthase
VEVDGRLATLGDRVDPSRARITVDGVPVPAHPELRYLALNKPEGVTTTLRDPHAERTLTALLPPGPRVYPVGRLDRESEGLLLLTNDGELAHRLQHPRYGVEKEYLVEVSGVLPRSALRRLTGGIELEEGPARAVRTGPIQRGSRTSALSVVMLEGRKREIRRMFEAIGHPVTRLVRTRLGPIRLGRLPPGKVRPLSTDEVHDAYRITGLDRAQRRTRTRERDTKDHPNR